jgi:hypothetical protein
MATKCDFSADQWNIILESPMMAGIAVTAADPSGLWGLLQESMASAKVVLGAGRAEAHSELLTAISAEFESTDGRTVAREGLGEQLNGCKPSEITGKAVEVLRRAVAIVEAQAPAEAPEFKTWLHSISRKVAEASLEGGILGFGGVRVSEAETATLTQISEALGLEAATRD